MVSTMIEKMEERIRELENRTIEITQSKEHRENRFLKKNKQNLNDHQNYNKRANIWVIRVSEGKEKAGAEKVYSQKKQLKFSQILQKRS